MDPNYHPCTLGFNPCWEQTLHFQLRAPELVLVRFVVEDYDTTSPNDFVGQSTLPLSSLKQGMMGGGERGGEGLDGAPASDLWLPPPQGTATSTCCPRMEPHSLQPRSSCTSAFRTLEGVTDLTLTSAGAGVLAQSPLWSRRPWEFQPLTPDPCPGHRVLCTPGGWELFGLSVRERTMTGGVLSSGFQGPPTLGS